ncbi:sensor histidine kinase [Actinoplanes sp. URMC 104]|uniref:sensor histidine kinase n=1 Tax=Actinoplanes sp. URMC 104 TaxID=3423409 RepID=UPI003F1DF6D6
MRRDRLEPGDWSVPAGLFAYGTFEAALDRLPHPALMLPLYAVACAALVFRRRRAVAALAVVAGCWAVPIGLGLFSLSSSGTVLLTVTVFACGRYGRRPWAYAALPAGSVVALASVVVDPDDSLTRSWPWGLWVVPVFALGTWFRQLREQSEREATQRVRTAAAEERIQIARELHDVLAHSVTLMVVQAEAAEELMDTSPDTAKGAVRAVQRAGRDALQDTRRLLSVLRAPDAPGPHAPLPGLPELPGLVEALRASGLPVDCRLRLDGAEVPAVAGRAAYRVVQEALTNTLRHAGPVPTLLEVGADDGRLVVAVSDSGAVRHRRKPGGHGLAGMRERVESCGGTLVAEQTADGFRVRAEIPLGAGRTP